MQRSVDSRIEPTRTLSDITPREVYTDRSRDRWGRRASSIGDRDGEGTIAVGPGTEEAEEVREGQGRPAAGQEGLSASPADAAAAPARTRPEARPPRLERARRASAAW